MLKYEDLKIGDAVTIIYGKRNSITGIYEDTTKVTKIIALKSKKVRKIQVEFSRLWFSEVDLNVSIKEW